MVGGKIKLANKQLNVIRSFSRILTLEQADAGF